MMETEIVWSTADNSTGTKTLAQHAYKAKMRGKYYGEPYEGNVTLCGQFGIMNEDEKFMKVSEIDSEHHNKQKACKTCTKIYESRDKS